MDVLSLILLLVVSFFSAIMGTMMGMAMLVLVPVMIFLGIPVHTAVATGRFSMVGINIGNISKFSKSEKIKSKYVMSFAIAGIVGALVGASVITSFNEKALKVIIGIFMIIISISVLFGDFIKSKKFHRKITFKHHSLSGLSGILIGVYMGIIGGGGATLVIFLLVLIYGLSFHDAVANQKAVTLPISIIATLVFIYQGLIDYKIGIPLFIVNLMGGWIGADLVLKFKTAWLKMILVPVSIALAIKLILF
ncbi:MAG: sulfite exporter TauE/SafE family protein [Nanoarchaeota archaeon]|nr:sulfite exporter TauE/SafE family protein [Nanoarchaeota archaeon]